MMWLVSVRWGPGLKHALVLVVRLIQPTKLLVRAKKFDEPLCGLRQSGRALQLLNLFTPNFKSQPELEGFSLRPNFAVKVIDFSCFLSNS